MFTNQFVTLDEADTYLLTVLDTEAWDLSTDSKRAKALKQATRMIKALAVPDFMATANDALTKIASLGAEPIPAELLAQSVMPEDIIAATVEIALKLLDGYDVELEFANASIASVSFNSIKQDNKTKEEIPLHVIAGIPSAYAFSLLRGYMPNSKTVHLNRVN